MHLDMSAVRDLGEERDRSKVNFVLYSPPWCLKGLSHKAKNLLLGRGMGQGVTTYNGAYGSGWSQKKVAFLKFSN